MIPLLLVNETAQPIALPVTVLFAQPARLTTMLMLQLELVNYAAIPHNV